MKISLIITIAANSALLFDYLPLWYISMAIMGGTASIYILSWSFAFSFMIEPKDHIKIIAAVMLFANLIMTVLRVFVDLLHEKAAMLLILIPLTMSLYILHSRYFNSGISHIKPYIKLPVPKSLITVFMIIIFIIYLNGGFMYRIMLPEISTSKLYGAYYPFVIYMSVLFLICMQKKSINRSLFIYPGISFLGLAFITFLLIGQSGPGFILTIGLMESSLALLDIFLWVTLGSLSYIYGSPHIIFGMLLAANTAGILFGDITGEIILAKGNDPYLLTALVSSASILTAVSVIPWLINSVEQKLLLIHESKSNEIKESSAEPLADYLLPGKTLTEREIQVLSLILDGMTNKDMAMTLYISEHTVKTHVKNIIAKYGVSRKRDLLLLSNRLKNQNF